MSEQGPLPIALLLPGQGSQHDRMAVGLYQDEPVFTAAMDEVFAAMGRDGDRLRADWVADSPSVPLDHVTRSQPLLFAVDYALGRLVLSWGVRPAALLGHSVGELVAATLAGVFELADAARLVHDRVSRLADAPPGGMLAAAATPAELQPVLDLLRHRDVVIGAINAPRQTVLAGPEEALGLAEKLLYERGLSCRRVPSSSAFHSPALAPAMRGAERLIASVAVRAPDIPIYSGYTAGPLGPAEVVDPEFWARQPVAPVLFWPALDALLATRDYVLIETGPSRGLITVARRHRALRDRCSTAIPLLPARPGTPEDDRASLRNACHELRAAGYAV